MARSLAHLVLALLLAGCAQTSIVPLVGEGPEVLKLLNAQPPDDPSTSALAAARRLHQALIQQDMELAWALLGPTARAALDSAGEPSGMKGRELLDASSLPAPGGTVQKVQFDAILIGPKAIELRPSEETRDHASRRVVHVICSDGSEFDRVFELQEGGWKLAMNTIPGTE